MWALDWPSAAGLGVLSVSFGLALRSFGLFIVAAAAGAVVGGAAVGALAMLLVNMREEDYTLECEVDAPLSAVFELLTDVHKIAEIHPHLSGVHRVVSQERGPTGAVVEWELETSAMWKPPWPLGFLARMKTLETVHTIAMRNGDHARITNVGLKGYRGKIVPFYYLHWWDLTAVGDKTRVVEYELLKGWLVKFWLGAMPATLATHRQLQKNLQQWAVELRSRGG